MKIYTLLIAAIFFAACSTPKKINQSMSFDFQGHRGCRGLMPENTIAAMLKAIDLGVTTLEMDVVITKDKQVVLSHDPYFSHLITTKPDGSFVTAEEEKKLKIWEMNYDEVAKFDVGLKPHPNFKRQQKIAAIKPRLEDVIDEVNDYCKKKGVAVPFYNIETKCKPTTDNIYHPEPKEFVELLMEVIKRKRLEDKVIVQSFDVRTLQYLHQQYPKMTTALLVEDSKGFDEKIKELGFEPNIYSPQYLLVTPQLIANCKSKGIKILPWTVNNAGAIKRLKRMGVDGIITDYPDLSH